MSNSNVKIYIKKEGVKCICKITFLKFILSYIEPANHEVYVLEKRYKNKLRGDYSS